LPDARMFLFLMKKYLPFLILCLLLAALMMLPACREEQGINLDLNFSVNVANPEKNFPNLEAIADSKKDVFYQYGRPDFIRLWWTSDGKPQRYLDVDTRLRDPRVKNNLNQSWIYLKNNAEFIFDSSEQYRQIPLTDKTLIICQYGDPEDVKEVTALDGALEETWNYFSRGVILRFRDDKIVHRQNYTPMGRFIKK